MERWKGGKVERFQARRAELAAFGLARLTWPGGRSQASQCAHSRRRGGVCAQHGVLPLAACQPTGLLNGVSQQLEFWFGFTRSLWRHKTPPLWEQNWAEQACWLDSVVALTVQRNATRRNHRNWRSRGQMARRLVVVVGRAHLACLLLCQHQHPSLVEAEAEAAVQ